MPYVITYRHKGERHERTAEAPTAAAALKFHDHLTASEAEGSSTLEGGRALSLGELKNEAGRGATDAR